MFFGFVDNPESFIWVQTQILVSGLKQKEKAWLQTQLALGSRDLKCFVSFTHILGFYPNTLK